jgi:uncharacterized protein
MFIKELTTLECFESLQKKRFGRLACAMENQPYIVPFHFAFDGGKFLYAFSTPGQKIEWMRLNPLVCIQADDITNRTEWTSLVVSGRYEELLDNSDFAAERNLAYELLSRRAMWWQPAYVSGTHRKQVSAGKPIYFRILIEKITGRSAVSVEREQLTEPNQPVSSQKSRFWSIW